MDGWICLFRKVQESKIWNNDERFDKRSAWISLLLKASHKNTELLVGNKVIKLKKGSFISSEVKLAREWKWDRKTVRTFLKFLEIEKMIVKESTTKYTSITIVDWEMYQNKEQQIPQQIPQPIPQQVPIKFPTINNDNKIYNIPAKAGIPNDNQRYAQYRRG